MKKKQSQNMVTMKIEYHCDSDFSQFIVDYNKVLQFTYNRLLEDQQLSTKQITEIQKGMKNKPKTIGSHLMNSAIFDAKAIIDVNNKPIIFGGKLNFIKRCQHKIDKEKFIKNRNLPLYSVGESTQRGNRLFMLINQSTVIFKPNRENHFTLNLLNVGRKRSSDIKKLIQLQNTKGIAITYKLDFNFVYITFDYNKLHQNFYNVKQNRVMAIDMNPNFLGWSVVDWKDGDVYHIISSGTISLKPLNDYQNSLNVSSDSNESKYIANKRRHEIIEIAKGLFNICKHFRCEVFALEGLKFNKNTKQSRKWNRLINNQWNRNLLYNQIKKRVMSSSTLFQEVQPQYSSFIGNLVFRQEELPDEILASIEIGRRGYEFSNQYIFNRQPHQKTVVFPLMDTVKNRLSISLAEIGVDVPELVNWKNLYSVVKKSEKKYRFSISDAIISHSDSLFSKFHKHKYIQSYVFL